jgi:DNA helicase II / ATP-dependent DNA helicase PcrA
MGRMVDAALLQHELNEEQGFAASKIEGPMLILAGAGSGKTRAITYKISHLISAHDVDPRRILAVTFTNKAAREMKSRIQTILDSPVNLEWMGTFHSVCVRILRLCLGNPQLVGSLGWKFNKNFSIYDDDDQKRILKEVVKPVLGDELDALTLKKIKGAISRYKNSCYKQMLPDGTTKLVLQTPAVVLEKAQYSDEEQYARFYRDYQKSLAEANAMDFDDLLGNTVDLLQRLPKVAAQFAHRFEYVVVDEYQDTNDVQYELLKLLINESHNVTVVGDDDQSIYGWRGANIDIIRNFHRDFSPVTIVKFERNYRSTANIVQGAGSVIAHNDRPLEMKKEVYSKQEKGDLIHVLHVDDDRVEADKIARSIWNAGLTLYSETAIFYRTNAQSRALEKALNDLRIPCVIYGGTRFWDRKEIRDILAYLRILANPRDDAAFLRIINTPPRQIGKTTVDQIRERSATESVSFWEALCSLVESGVGRSVVKLSDFKKTVDGWLDLVKGGETAIPLLAEKIIKDSFYREFLKKEDETTADDRCGNLDEMINALREFEEEYPDQGLDAFLQDISLLTDADKKVENVKDRVTLMTIHMAKGLEFHTVHIAGCDECIFPLIRAGALMQESAEERKKQTEEERRLFYVGCTRAKKQLSLYHAERRFWQGSIQNFPPSRFLEELDPLTTSVEGLEDFSVLTPLSSPSRSFDNFRKPQTFAPRDFAQKSNTRHVVYKNAKSEPKPESQGPRIVYDEYSENPFHPGVKVRHGRFGSGVLLSCSGSGEDARVEVRFGDGTVRKLVLKFASLEIVG